MKPNDGLTFREMLTRDHKRLDGVLEEVLASGSTEVAADLEARWDAYEACMLAHLDAEEMFLLPALTRHDASLADRVVKEHGTIRELLAEVGVALELHLVRDEHIRKLAKFLHDHAAMEEELYVWADDGKLHKQHSAISRRLHSAWKSLLQVLPAALTAGK